MLQSHNQKCPESIFFQNWDPYSLKRITRNVQVFLIEELVSPFLGEVLFRFFIIFED